MDNLFLMLQDNPDDAYVDWQESATSELQLMTCSQLIEKNTGRGERKKGRAGSQAPKIKQIFHLLICKMGVRTPSSICSEDTDLRVVWEAAEQERGISYCRGCGNFGILCTLEHLISKKL